MEGNGSGLCTRTGRERKRRFVQIQTHHPGAQEENESALVTWMSQSHRQDYNAWIKRDHLRWNKEELRKTKEGELLTDTENRSERGDRHWERKMTPESRREQSFGKGAVDSDKHCKGHRAMRSFWQQVLEPTGGAARTGPNRSQGVAEWVMKSNYSGSVAGKEGVSPLRE